MKYAEILRARATKARESVQALDAERSALKAEAEAITADESRSLTADEDARLSAILARNAEIKTESDAIIASAEADEARAVELDSLEVERSQAPTHTPQIMKRVATDVDVRNASRGEVRDAARKIVDQASRFIDAERQATFEGLVYRDDRNLDGDKLARYLVATEPDAYRSAFGKAISQPTPVFTAQEADAINEARAMSLTTTAGGFGIPVLIDPTVISTTGTGLLGILPHVRIENITSKEWKAVTAGATAWSFDAEAAEVSDDASTFAQPTVTAHKAQALIPFSIEIGQDYPGFANEMSTLLSEGYYDLLANKMMTGTGTTEPWGLFIATTTTVDVTTDNTFGAADIDKVWAALPEKRRASASWVMNVDVENDVRGFGSGTATSRFTVDQTSEGISLLNGKRVILSDYAPTWTGTDGANILIVGDLKKYCVAQRIGMTVELIPHLTSTGNNRPSGQRGLYAFARVGANVLDSGAFRKLKNITT